MDEKTQKYLKYGLHAAILLGVIWATFKYVNGQDVIAALRQFNYRLAPIMIVLALGSLLFKAVRFYFLLRPFAQEISLPTIVKAYVAGQGATVLPGGVAARAGLIRQIGIPIGVGSAPVLVNSLMDQALFIVVGLLTALWYPAARLPGLILLGVLAVGALLFVLELSRKWLLDLAERLARRLNLVDQWHNFVDSLPRVLTKKILLAGLLTTIIAFILDALVLQFALEGLGLSVSYTSVILAFILPTILGRIVPIPAGLGVTEATMVGFLTAVAALDPDSAVAAVALFRVAGIFLPILVGAFIYFFFWQGEKEGSRRKAKMETARASNVDL